MQYELTVDRRELVNGLRRFIRKEVWPSQKAVIGFDGRFFSIKASNRAIVAHAEGTWPGLAYVRSNAIIALALAPPDAEPLRICCDGKRITFGTYAIFCAWQPISSTLLSLPATPDWVEALSRGYRSSSARNRTCEPTQGKITTKSEQQLARLVAQAVKALYELGITEQDIRSLLDKRLRGSVRPNDK
jgi:hypothetical protein